MKNTVQKTIDTIDRRILDELQRNGALSAADVASKVGLSTTTCWRRIQQLEQDLGLQLIDRSKRPFSMSPEGQTYYDGVKTLLSEYSKLESGIKHATSAIAGK